MLLCNIGLEEFQGSLHQLSALFVDKNEIDDLHLVQGRLLKGSALEAGCIVGRCLRNQNTKSTSGDFIPEVA